MWFILIISWVCSQFYLFIYLFIYLLVLKEPYWVAQHQFFWNIKIICKSQKKTAPEPPLFGHIGDEISKIQGIKKYTGLQRGMKLSFKFGAKLSLPFLFIGTLWEHDGKGFFSPQFCDLGWSDNYGIRWFSYIWLHTR